MYSSGYSSSYGSSSSSVSNSSEQPAGAWAIGLVRIIIGVLWYTQLLWHSPRDWGSATSTCTTNLKATGLTGLCDWMHRAALRPISADLSIHVWSTSISHTFSTSLYADFMKNTVLPHFTLFAWIAFVIEVFLAVSLVLGLFVRIGGLIGTLWALNLLIALWSVSTGWSMQTWWYWSFVMLAGLNLIFFATRAGRYLGLDAGLTEVRGPLGNLFRVLG